MYSTVATMAKTVMNRWYGGLFYRTQFQTWYPYIWCTMRGMFVWICAHRTELHSLFFLHISVPVHCMAVCQHWHLLNFLLDSRTMASLCVLSYTMIIWCLSLCVFVFLCMCGCVCSPFNKKVPLCYKSTPSSVMLQGRRQDEANQRWYVHTQQEEKEEESFTQNCIHQQKEMPANSSWCCHCHVHVKGWKSADTERRNNILFTAEMGFSLCRKHIAFRASVWTKCVWFCNINWTKRCLSS